MVEPASPAPSPSADGTAPGREPAGPPADAPAHERPTIAVIFYRAHELSGNTGFIDTLCAAITERGGTPLPVYCSSLRSADPGLADLLRPASAIITTVLAAGGSAAGQGAEGDWDAGALARLGVPLIQGLCLTSSRGQWQDAAGGLSPIDAAMQVAIPEFDGRLIAVPFSFKEEDAGRHPGDLRRRPPGAASIAVGHARARLAAIPEPRQARRHHAVLLPDEAFPGRQRCFGLDTPASRAVCLPQVARGPLRPRRRFSRRRRHPHPHADRGGRLRHRMAHRPAAQRRTGPRPAGRLPPLVFFSSATGVQQKLTSHWAEPPGERHPDGDDIVLASLRFGNVVVMIQPPRGFGENPVAIYHDPELPPSHHYLAAYLVAG